MRTLATTALTVSVILSGCVDPDTDLDLSEELSEELPLDGTETDAAADEEAIEDFEGLDEEDYDRDRRPADGVNQEMAAGDDGAISEIVRLALDIVHPYGGTFLEESYTQAFGQYCAPGYVRSHANVYKQSGHGNCNFSHWYSDDPRDCRAVVRFQTSAMWMNGNCHIQVYEDRDTNTCAGSCGTQAPGGCWCDSLCSAYGDCCNDYALQC